MPTARLGTSAGGHVAEIGKARQGPRAVRRFCSAATISLMVMALTAGPPSAMAAHAKATADRAGTAERASQRVRPAAGQQRYAIEFRSRYALSYGHVFLMYGPINAKGAFMTRTVAGLHPAGDDPKPWMLGHVVPVVSETGPSDGDLEDEYMSANYRIEMGPEEYARVVSYVKAKQANSPTWHAVFNNCAGWVGDVGSYMGLKVPAPLFVYPKDYINKMKAMNEGNDRSAALSLAR